MIVLRFTSGLGNQMFQYSFYRYLKRRYPDATIKADLGWYEWNHAHQGFELDKIFERSSILYARYSDDIIFFAESEEEKITREEHLMFLYELARGYEENGIRPAFCVPSSTPVSPIRFPPLSTGSVFMPDASRLFLTQFPESATDSRKK